MIITSKYFSKCPVCNENILKGAQVSWNPGEKAIHVHCQQLSIEEITKIAKEENKNKELTYITSHDGLHYFKGVFKKGKVIDVIYTEGGQKIFREDYETVINGVLHLYMGVKKYEFLSEEEVAAKF
ncbi:hypothetical protein ACDN41_12545 [Priestia aryabhattai]|uniref:hypothetical protein n=1 Tax=Priestia aryabhattai TaxID=412384 RepID=UPI0035322122